MLRLRGVVMIWDSSVWFLDDRTMLKIKSLATRVAVLPQLLQRNLWDTRLCIPVMHNRAYTDTSPIQNTDECHRGGCGLVATHQMINLRVGIASIQTNSQEKQYPFSCHSACNPNMSHNLKASCRYPLEAVVLVFIDVRFTILFFMSYSTQQIFKSPC